MSKLETLAEVKTDLRVLVGLRWTATRSLLATRHFYFSRVGEAVDSYNRYCTVGVECPWRLESGDSIIVGSDDYYQPATGNDIDDWDIAEPRLDMQNELLQRLWGPIVDGEIVTSGNGFIVESVECDVFGGLRIVFADSVRLILFPASSKRMEWIFMQRGSGKRSWLRTEGMFYHAPSKQS